MENIFKKIKKGVLLLILLVVLIYVVVFFISPSSVIDFYRGEDEYTIWAKTKYFPIKKEISRTDTYKFSDIKWSPDKTHVSFYDMVMEETFDKEWALKIIDPRLFKIRTIFIGNYKTSEYKWMDDKIVRVYVGVGTGVRIYRDIDIDISEPLVFVDDASSEFWTPMLVKDGEWVEVE